MSVVQVQSASPNDNFTPTPRVRYLFEYLVEKRDALGHYSAQDLDHDFGQQISDGVVVGTENSQPQSARVWALVAAPLQR